MRRIGSTWENRDRGAVGKEGHMHLFRMPCIAPILVTGRRYPGCRHNAESAVVRPNCTTGLAQCRR